MDKIIKALHLRLDSTSKSLTKNAISQLIIKILFQNSSSISLSEIENEIQKVLKAKIEDSRVEEAIGVLLEKNEIHYSEKKYSLTRSNRRTLDKRYQESKDRLERIVDNYFKPFYSENNVVIDWFSDMTVEFFKEYSTEWTSDLCIKKSEKLKVKKEDIFNHLQRRTHHNKNLNKDDYESLINKFIDCLINKKDPDLDAHLWQYGTSAFAANLLQSSIGADPISINAFRDSKCILDTNVLMNVGLEASDYHDALKKLDIIFNVLNITPGYFSITKQEYEKTVSNKSKEILKNVSKFSYDVIKEVDDQFIQSAIKRKCHLYEDFEIYCEQIIKLPSKIDSHQEIEHFNNDEELDIVISNAQANEKKKELINKIFKDNTGNDKREAPLIHDVGIIAGSEFYRNKEKAFILSQEISINKYSQTIPIKNDLPLAIKLETLINMLAIDNGGTEVNPIDFSNLFADIIRFNLQPDKDTFKMADLSRILDTELQIEQLPAEEVISIANKLHSNRLRGLPDEEISLELHRQFQEVKLKFINDLEVAHETISYERKEKESSKKRLSKTESALKERILIEETNKYEKDILLNKVIWFFAIPFLISILLWLGYFYYSNNSLSDYKNYILGIIINFSIWGLTSFLLIKPKLISRNELKKLQININAEKRFSEETS